MTRESEAARERRRSHERQLERVGGSGTDAGQALLDKWWREELASRGVTSKLSQGTDTTAREKEQWP